MQTLFIRRRDMLCSVRWCVPKALSARSTPDEAEELKEQGHGTLAVRRDRSGAPDPHRPRLGQGGGRFGAGPPAQGRSGDQCRGRGLRGRGPRRCRDGRRCPRARPCAAAAAWCAGDHQDQHRRRRHADRQRRHPAQGLHRQGRQSGRRQPAARRRDHRRPHQCAGLLDAHLQRQRAPWPHAQSARSDGDAGRFERRRGCGDRGRHRPDRARQRHRRVDPVSGALQRRGRPAHRFRPHPLLQRHGAPMPVDRSAAC